ncbi:MAG TPA: choice-of-anchor Q domain-containing protein [Planctomycetota bacterium]|nr:choice-of-anchor Q domain-containing protein [Planctomycetota bacterium]
MSAGPAETRGAPGEALRMASRGAEASNRRGRISAAIALAGLLGAAALASSARLESATPSARCKRCGWAPPETKMTHTASSVEELRKLLGQASPDTTILLEDGKYVLDRMLDIARSDIVLCGKSGDPTKVVLCGDGMLEKKVGVAISISAPRVTIADLTAANVGYHGVQVRGEKGASGTVLHNIRILDTGQQLLKGSTGKADVHADDCVVACSYLGFTDSAPGSYTNGVDVLAGKGWHVRDNEIVNIRGPREKGWKAGPAILFWANSMDTVVERNLIRDCFRGIAFGLGPGASKLRRGGEQDFDHQGGVIRNNVVLNLNPWADEGIEANAARDVRIQHNTVLVEGACNWSIGVRFKSSSGAVQNNLTSRNILFRNGGKAALEGNVAPCARDWFVEAEKGNLRLARGDSAAIDAGVPLPGLEADFDGQPRVSGARPDAGAFEHVKRKD